MLLDGNNMIELLSLPEWDERIVAMLEEFGEERPVYNPHDTTIFITRKDYGFEIMFDDWTITKNKRRWQGKVISILIKLF